jgi:superfamily II DNA or RNA helicase
MNNLFDHSRIIDQGPHEFRRSVQRLMIQNGFNAFSVDGPGDEGGDIFCERNGEKWIIQCKWKKNGTITHQSVEEAMDARSHYGAHKAIIASNQTLSLKGLQLLKHLREAGISIDLWHGDHLRTLVSKSPVIREPKQLRPYQIKAIQQIKADLEIRCSSLLYLATGLGKTVVVSAIISELYSRHTETKVLVLAHTNELVEQLQIALWGDLPIHVSSQLVNAQNRPNFLEGLTIATNLSILKYIDAGYRPDLIVIDECHHIGEDNFYSKIIKRMREVPLLGVTATPWRGDGYNMESIFGKPSYVCGIEEGMRQGFLSPVEYRLFCDNINWDDVPSISKNAYTIKQLSRKLFIPQRDEQILDSLSEEWLKIEDPKGIIFCQGVPHAERIHYLLRKYDRWKNAEILHSKLGSNARKFALLRFRSKDCPILVAVDILNEGVDVPNVNIVCFARVTHSRKIFVQQLGRGLRVAPGKRKVVVLDFAADVRRLAAIANIDSEMSRHGELEIINYSKQNRIEFTDQRAEQLIKEWIKDAADLETMGQESRLQFPEIYSEQS